MSDVPMHRLTTPPLLTVKKYCDKYTEEVFASGGGCRTCCFQFFLKIQCCPPPPAISTVISYLGTVLCRETGL